MNLFAELNVAKATTSSSTTQNVGEFNSIFAPSLFGVKLILPKDATKQSLVIIKDLKSSEEKTIVLSKGLSAHHRAGIYSVDNLGVSPIYKSINAEGKPVFSIGLVNDQEFVTAGRTKFVAPVLTLDDFVKTATI